jgi:hypothetical protein
MASWARAFCKLAAIWLLALVLPGCGGGSGPTTPSTPTPAPVPVRTTVVQGVGTLAAPEANGNTHFGTVPFTTSSAGTVEATVDWTFPTNTVWMFIAMGSCSGQQFANVACPDGPGCPCQFATGSEASAPKPRVLTVSNAAAGPYTLIVWNLGPREESVSYQVVAIHCGCLAHLGEPQAIQGRRLALFLPRRSPPFQGLSPKRGETSPGPNRFQLSRDRLASDRHLCATPSGNGNKRNLGT